MRPSIKSSFAGAAMATAMALAAIAGTTSAQAGTRIGGGGLQGGGGFGFHGGGGGHYAGGGHGGYGGRYAGGYGGYGGGGYGGGYGYGGYGGGYGYGGCPLFPIGLITGYC
jgi:hypothetical protein